MKNNAHNGLSRLQNKSLNFILLSFWGGGGKAVTQFSTENSNNN